MTLRHRAPQLRSLASPAGHAALLHAVAHIEFNAIKHFPESS